MAKRWRKPIKNILRNSLFSAILTLSGWGHCASFLTHRPASTISVAVSPLSKRLALNIVARNATQILKKGINNHALDPEKGQSFHFNYRRKEYSFISTTRQSATGISAFTCSLLLFDEKDVLIDIQDTIGVSESRPWTCDGVSSIAFIDDRATSSLLILAMYIATAPSSERFTVPIAIRYVPSISFVIDESATKKMGDAKVKSIKAARKVLLGN